MYKFKKDTVVCFLGDSITARGRWICRVLDVPEGEFEAKFEEFLLRRRVK